MEENEHIKRDDSTNRDFEEESSNWEGFIKKYWIYLLGGLFLFTAFLYFLKLAVEEGWITPVARVILGFVLGSLALFLGYRRYQKHKNLISEIAAAVGSVILFSSLGYAGYSPDIPWSTYMLVIYLVVAVVMSMWLSYRSEMRILGFLTVFGGLVTSFAFKPPAEQVYIVAIYVLVINVASIFLSSKKNWSELRVTSFLITAILFIAYYAYYDPQTWKGPVVYLTSFFVVYFFGLILSSIHEHDFEGVNLYMGLLNVVNFLFWSLYIFNTFSVPYFAPVSIGGLLFLASSVMIYNKSGKAFLPSAVQFLFGVVMIAVAGDDLANLFRTGGMNHIINASIWLGLVIVIFYGSTLVKFPIGKEIGAAGLFIILIFWLAVAWDVEWVRWFGMEYIPFLNPGALVWIGLATTGFIFSRKMVAKELEDQESYNPNRANSLSIILAIASHLVVGGLLTIQIQNTWEAYELTFLRVDVILSISWMIYALLLFFWGAYSNQNTFRWMGSTVLVLTSIKVFVFDLSESSAINMVLFLFALGILTLIIAVVDKRWRKMHAER